MIKKAIRRTLAYFNPLFRKVGYIPYIPNKDLVHFFALIKKMGFVPTHIVDVGANHGGWTREALKFFPDAYYTLLEPNQSLEVYMKDVLALPRIKLNLVGAGSQSGKLKLAIGEQDNASTFSFDEKEASRNGLKLVEVPVVTLNELLIETRLPVPDLIKIDAEGFDLAVLKGASDFFGKTEIFMVEVGVAHDAFENSLLTIMNFMDNNGYKIFEITHLNRYGVNNLLGLAELCFIKRNGFLDLQRKF